MGIFQVLGEILDVRQPEGKENKNPESREQGPKYSS